jgi:Family of unknown function (DUF5681)
MTKKTKRSRSEPYEVGYGRPPKGSRFQKGQSGNPSGQRKQQQPSIAAELRAQLQGALNTEIPLEPGEQKHAVTMGAAGIVRLVEQFAEGDHRARRDVIVLAEKLGIDLTAGQERAIGHAVMARLTKEDEEIKADFLRRHGVEPERRDAETDPVDDQADTEAGTEMERVHLDDTEWGRT